MKALFGLLFVSLVVTGCSSASKEKITKHEINSDSHRVIYGKIKDLNPESITEKLGVTFVTSDKPHVGTLAFDNKFPFKEPRSDFFWVTIPKNSTYFGIYSIRFSLEGVDGEAIIRNDKTHLPLFGIDLPKGNAPVYIGEITIRSGMKKYGVGFVEGFDLKEAYIKTNPADAKEFLDKNGYESSEYVVLPFKLKAFQEAKSSKSHRNQL